MGRKVGRLGTLTRQEMLKSQISGFGEGTDQEAVGVVPVHGDTLLPARAERRLKLADGDGELDFAIVNEVQFTDVLKEPSGCGVGPRHEKLAEEGEGEISKGKSWAGAQNAREVAP